VTARVLDRWTAFWFADGNPFSLALFRVAFAACLAIEIETSRHMSVFALEGGFHLPYLRWVPLLDPASYEWAHRVQYPLLLCLGLGIATRVAAGGLLVLQGWIFLADRMNFRNHAYFFLLVLVLLLVSPCDRTLSLRSWLAGRRGLEAILHPPAAPLTAQRLIQLQVSIVYFYAALMKLNPQFLRGEVVASQVRTWLDGGDVAAAAEGAARAAGAAPEPALLWAALSIAAILVESFLVFGLWLPRTRGVAMASGVLFHLGLGVVIAVWTFSLGYLATYVLFLDPDTLPRILERRSSRALKEDSAEAAEERRGGWRSGA
jgi:hypothetical protein